MLFVWLVLAASVGLDCACYELGCCLWVYWFIVVGVFNGML